MSAPSVRDRANALATLVALLLLASCTRGPQPVEAPPSVAPPTTDTVPRPEKPRTLARSAMAPCGLLNEAQLGDLAIQARGTERRLLSGYFQCYWSDRLSDQRVDLTAYGDQDTLRAALDRPLFPLAQPVTVVDLPALAQRQSPTSISCTLTVGIAESQGMDLTFTSLRSTRAGQDPCTKATQVATMVVTNLPPLR